MKIKSLIAGLLAGVLMMGNLSAVCFAAGGDAVPTSGDRAVETVETDKAGDTAETVSPTLPDGFTLGKEIVLPDGVTIDEDGNFSFFLDGWGWSMGDRDEPETVEETTTIGTVNVRSDTYLNLRSGSGMEYSVIGHLLRGAEVEVVGESGNWYEVVIPEATGYVYKD